MKIEYLTYHCGTGWDYCWRTPKENKYIFLGYINESGLVVTDLWLKIEFEDDKIDSQYNTMTLNIAENQYNYNIICSLYKDLPK